MSDNDESAERFLLTERFRREEGSLEEQEAWITRLQAIDPLFRQSDFMLSLEDSVRLHRRVQTLREELGTPLTRDQLIALVRSIDYSQASTSEEIDDLTARSLLFASSVPHPDAERLIDRVWSDQDMSAEAAVDVALSWRVPDKFCLPGTVGGEGG